MVDAFDIIRTFTSISVLNPGEELAGLS